MDSRRVDEVANRFQVPRQVARLLCARLRDDKQMAEVVWPERIDWTDPFDFHGMAAAVQVLAVAIREGQLMGIMGDYDVDGVTSCAIVANMVHALGGTCEIFIPHRVEDGYGLSTNLVDRAIAAGCQCLVTVDNGIRCEEAVAHAVRQGVTVVVTDHHEPGEGWPDSAAAIVHWLQSDHPDAMRLLSGAGVAWKLAQALAGAFSETMDQGRTTTLMDWLTALAGLGALADVMPMQGENRRLVRTALAALRHCSQPGWLALCELVKLDLQNLTETSLLWTITPRLNAAGRMDHADVALALLLAQDAAEANAYAQALEDLNRQRRLETDRATKEAEAQLERLPSGTAGLPVIVVRGEWPLGVVGIVAAKLSDRYARPAIVFADDGGGVLKGSGRAPEGMPLLQWLEQTSDWLEHFGGHETALGCAVRADRYSDWVGALMVAAERMGTSDSESAQADAMCDDYLPIREANLETASWLEQLGPYGNSFVPFQFYVGPVSVQSTYPMGNGKHLRLTVQEGRESAQLVWFHAPEWAFQLERGSCIAAIAALEVNNWRGQKRPQLRVHEGFVLRNPLLREDFAAVYRLLRARRQVTPTEASDAMQIPAGTATTVFDTFVDLGFASCGSTAYHVVEQAEPRDLRESVVYQAHLSEVIDTDGTAG